MKAICSLETSGIKNLTAQLQIPQHLNPFIRLCNNAISAANAASNNILRPKENNSLITRWKVLRNISSIIDGKLYIYIYIYIYIYYNVSSVPYIVVSWKLHHTF
jgi:hypothetical protein